ncbi:phage tail tip lysozyme [Streptococcus agalactiae]
MKTKRNTKKIILGLSSMGLLLCNHTLTMAEVYQGYAPTSRVSCITTEDDSSTKDSSGTNTNSSNASDTDPFKDGTTANANAKKVFMAFVNSGLSGQSAAGSIGWVNSEGGFAMIGRAQGHYGNDLEGNSISKGAVPNTGGTSNTVGGGGIFQFDPYTKYAPLNSADWEDADKMVAYVIKAIAGGDWNPAYDESGHNWSFAEFAKQTNIDDTAMAWNAYERGNMAYVKPDQKKGDAKRFATVFNADKYKYDDSKFQKVFGGGGSSSDNSSDSSSSSSKKKKKKSSSTTKLKVDTDKAIDWYKQRLGKVTYSQTNRTGTSSYDCSSSLYYALTGAGADKTSGDYAVSTETEHEWLIKNGYEKVYDGKWSDNGEIGKTKKGDIFIWGKQGSSSGNLGHTGIFEDDNKIIHCNFSGNGITENDYDSYKKKATDHEWVYIYRQKGSDTTDETSDDTNDCDASDVVKSNSKGGSGWASDGGSVSGYMTYNAWKPTELPDNLKPYAIDVTSLGMKYSSSTGWASTMSGGGQCTTLTASLGNLLWAKGDSHPMNEQGNGKDVVGNWASKFGGKSTTTPTSGAIFSQTAAGAGNGYGHTGLVSHVFGNGDMLLVEQNFSPLSGSDGAGTPFTWNYRYVSKADFNKLGFTFYDPSQSGYKIVSEAKALK